MDSLIFSLNATMPIFLLMVLGYGLNKVGLLDNDLADKLNSFVFKVPLPILLFMDLATVEVTDIWDPKFIMFCVVATIISIILAILLSKLLKKDRAEFVQGSYRSSVALLGIALTNNIYGSVGAAPLMIMFVVPIYNVCAVIVLSVMHDEKRAIDYKGTFINILKNPLIIGILLGAVFSLLKIHLPDIINSTLNMVSSTATPLGLMAMGATFDHKKALAEIKPALFATFMKLMGYCMVFLPIAVFLGFRNQELTSIMIMLGSSTTVSTFVMAKNMGHKGVLTCSTVMLTTLLSAFTITLWLTILRSFSLI